jgi:hypothetical protein
MVGDVGRSAQAVLNRTATRLQYWCGWQNSARFEGYRFRPAFGMWAGSSRDVVAKAKLGDLAAKRIWLAAAWSQDQQIR